MQIPMQVSIRETFARAINATAQGAESFIVMVQVILIKHVQACYTKWSVK